ncbi:MAG: 2-succinyl-6-hydroxy-2,4-cyclohexadiene-1-carboxylate synthase [Synechococcales bacterium]|nr:2-succinyl-6-hydroxy-2,4-cyclohexadiene-1-carboxylate synthase [Synechococcales bacterium]
MLHYRLYGNPKRPAIVFLHGFLGSGADWRDLVVGLGDRFYCICIDLPGHGRSLSLPETAYSMSGAAALVLQVLHSLSCNESVLYGYSMGGRLALYLALQFPTYWRSLYLESASPGLQQEAERWVRQQRDALLAEALEEDFLTFLTAWYEQPLFASLRSHPAFPAILKRRALNHPSELAKSLRAMGTGKQPSLWAELPDLEIPCHLVVGEWDAKFMAINQMMASLSNKILLFSMSQAGHNVHLENPQAIQNLLWETR